MSVSAAVTILRHISYAEGLHRQEQARKQVLQDPSKGVVLLCEHAAPVITLGKNSHRSFLLASPGVLSSQGISLHTTARGGQISLHAPGQWVVYPIVHLRSLKLGVKDYVQRLQLAVVDVLQELKIEGVCSAEYPGVWVPKHLQEKRERWDKIAAVGLSVQRGVTGHGFALNVACDLALYRLIVPCGIHPSTGRGVTSVVAEKPQLQSPDIMPQFIQPLLKALSHQLEIEMQGTASSSV